MNGDDRPDLMLRFPIEEIGIERGMTTLCRRGVLPDERAFTACDRTRTT